MVVGSEPVHPAGVWGRQVGVAVAELVVIVVGIGPVAGDQDPGDRPVTGQPPARLRVQRPAPTSLPTHPTRTEEAGQVDGD
jgi:hypothetical protein